MRVICRLNRNEWFWFLRPETGERNGRFHLHVLLRVPKQFVGHFVMPGGEIPNAHRVWGYGLTKFRFIEGRDDPAIPYVLSETAMNDAYEYGKFAKVHSAILSHAVLERMRRQVSVRGGEVGIAASASTLATNSTLAKETAR